MTIHENSNRLKALVWLGLFAALLMVLSVVILSGCTETLEGDIQDNLAPVVYFVNIPPDSSRFSYNPEVYWFGSDADGQIDYYRYLVATVTEIGSSDVQAALSWASNAHDTMWTYADVDPQSSDPQTAHIITLEANIDDPVRTYVEQFVFLQAFDDDNMGSTIVAKCLNRNDHPPDTRIINTMKNDTPYVNAPTAGGIVTGIKLTWDGSDVRDYDEQGLIPPPFEYQWRLYGPYTAQDTAEMFGIDSLIRTVFVTDEAEVYDVGDTLVVCDSHLVQDDSIYWEVECTTVVFYEATATNTTLGYRRDQRLDINNDWFDSYHLADSSWDGIDPWVWDMADTIYNVYSKDTTLGDTTVTRYFIFWIRSRDDASVPDLTPAFVVLPVINPMYERDIMVLDVTNMQDPGYGRIRKDVGISLRKGIFADLISGWIDTRSEPIVFDTSGSLGDYLSGIDYESNPLPLGKLLKYKTIIVYSDAVNVSKLVKESGGDVKMKRLFTAIDAGVNVWATGRAITVGKQNGWIEPPQVDAPTEVNHYFGVKTVFYSSWVMYLQLKIVPPILQAVRMEDWVGGYSMDESRWPNIDLDTALLHQRLTWWESSLPTAADCPWVDSVAALPEVGWCGRRYGTEVMYLYKSKYGPNHFLGFPYTIEGAPIGHRYETNLFRTVWLQFPPSCVNHGQMQQLTNSVLDWLYDPTLGQTTVSAKRYPDAATKISLDEACQLLEDRKLDGSE